LVNEGAAVAAHGTSHTYNNNGYAGIYVGTNANLTMYSAITLSGNGSFAAGASIFGSFYQHRACNSCSGNSLADWGGRMMIPNTTPTPIPNASTANSGVILRY